MPSRFEGGKVVRSSVGVSANGDGYTEEEFEFLKAIQEYKQKAQRPWPAWTEILAIAHSLGYRKVAAKGPLPKRPVIPDS